MVRGIRVSIYACRLGQLAETIKDLVRCLFRACELDGCVHLYISVAWQMELATKTSYPGSSSCITHNLNHFFLKPLPCRIPGRAGHSPSTSSRCMCSQFLLPLSLQRSLTSIMVTLVAGSMEGMRASLAIAPLETGWYMTTCFTSTLEEIIVIPPSPYSPYFSPSSSLPTPALTLPPLPPPLPPSPTHTEPPQPPSAPPTPRNMPLQHQLVRPRCGIHGSDPGACSAPTKECRWDVYEFDGKERGREGGGCQGGRREYRWIEDGVGKVSCDASYQTSTIKIAERRRPITKSGNSHEKGSGSSE
jgi:hypothetical protein